MKSESILEVIHRAKNEKWALGEFNMSNLEVLQAIVAAGNELHSPVIVGVSMGTLKHVGLNYLRGLIPAAKSEALVPLFFHLDHGADFETVKQVIEIGFDSVMLDSSRLALEENVKEVRRTVEYAHSHRAAVEAQVGEAGDEEKGIEGEEFTRPEDVPAFVERTGIDLLAFSFGSKPGRLEGESTPDIEIVRSITSISPVPCVLHGASSIPDDFIRQAIKLGAAKINIDAFLRKAVTKILHKTYSQAELPHDPRVAMRAVREAVKTAVMEKMRLFGSTDKV
jgi:fructose-bisphosphate aldolase class II